MDNIEQFYEEHENHKTILFSAFETYFKNATFVDCALIAENKFIFAHKVILSALSRYFSEMLYHESDNYSIVMLHNDVKYHALESVINFIYKGRLFVLQDNLEDFQQAAELLQVKGLPTSLTTLISYDDDLNWFWEEHQDTLLSSLKTFVKNYMFIDLYVQAEEEKFIAHKIVLSALSPYFEMLFLQEDKKLYHNQHVVLQDIKPDELETMINFMYKGELNIRADKFTSFLEAAEKYEIKGLPKRFSRSTRQQPGMSKSGLIYNPNLPSNELFYISRGGSCAYRKRKHLRSNIYTIDTRDEPTAKQQTKNMDCTEDQDSYCDSHYSTSSSNEQPSYEESSDSDSDRPNIQN